MTLLYDDWDRNPYESPFGAFPHDLAVRLFYLGRPASVRGGWRVRGCEGRKEPGPWADPPPCHAPPATLYIIGRDRDLPGARAAGPRRGPRARAGGALRPDVHDVPDHARAGDARSAAPPVADIGKPGVQR